jgi:predicted nuclease of predicted toxin-antitoxin system
MPDNLKLYLDQMLNVRVAEALKAAGHEVVRVSETGHARADDEQILRKSIAGDRVLITLDEHFGDWVVLPLRRHPGVVRIKVNPTTPENILRILIPFLKDKQQEDFKDHLIILSEKRVKWILTRME